MLNMFGRDYEEIGSSDKGLILKSSGKIKIQWGRKFIDLLDSEGNINIKLVKKKEEEPKVEEEQTQEGEQTTTSQQEEEQASTKTRDSTDKNEENNDIYVSFTKEQDTSKEQKYTALKNLGLVFETQKISNNYPKKGIIYIEDEQQLYIVNNGSLTKYNPKYSIPEEYLIEINNLKDSIEVLEQNNNSNLIQQLQQSIQSLTEQVNSLQLLVEQKSFTLACDPEDNQNSN